MLLCVSLKVMLLCEASQTSHNFVMVAEPLSLEQQETIFIQGYFGTISEANLSKIINIDQKRKKGTKNRALWYSRDNMSRQTRFTITHNRLASCSQVPTDPVQYVLIENKILQLLQQRQVKDTVKGFTIVKEYSTYFLAIFKGREPFLGH